MSDHKPASRHTAEVNAALGRELPFDDTQDFEDSHRGFIAPLPNGGVIKDDDGNVVWDFNDKAQAQEGTDAPDTVNPSLWRMVQLLGIGGLFEVTEGIYQVRGADLSNITFIEVPDGVVVMDPCLSAEPARFGLDLYREHRGDRPVVGVIYTHSHTDHYGGVRGIVDEVDVVAGKVQIVAPEGFVKATLDEFVIGGNACSRRTSLQYGSLVKGGPTGTMTAGLGLGTSTGWTTLIQPTVDITETGQKLNIGGLEFEFQLAPDSEAPSEMFFYIEQYRAFCPAEDATHTQHNLYTLRGAKIRDALAWSKHIKDARLRYADKTDVMFAPHHWPSWGKDAVVKQLKLTQAMYKHLHDQTMHAANAGYTMLEAAERIQLPTSLAHEWITRGYYGTTSHNVKSIWAFYLGWYSGNPAQLWELPPEPAASRYVEFMGGADAVLEKAQRTFDEGDYRWTAQVVNHVVFDDPTNERAKALLADTYEQLGYQAEAGTWRGWFVSGAKELREGVQDLPTVDLQSADTINAMPVDMFLDYLAIRLNAEKADGNDLTVNLKVTDPEVEYAVVVEHATLDYEPGNLPDADATVTLDRPALSDLMTGTSTIAQMVDDGRVTVDGDSGAVERLAGMLDEFEFWFNIVTP
ncbi:Alkyl sulfatase BDS1, metallo-beta-lactamase superfamily [Paraoerskovia marina]|uniref:Alkyl sulfatase BDS1, metallo-beta-lactamase superfamily n=1 Tax=Paraoerskovia marina TaxID=545619 RepID=A0A1H1N0J4_9CELL|nr:alkyl sulfatase dimerization domain-containing protein [Paraoerskovia marina]SDR92506.1 Alkyl sulfatase BDS1, metallo-beta-lactamase superfamily [Paraoerskovia marina]